MADTTAPARPRALWPTTALRVGFGVIWMVDAGLKWMPGFRQNFMSSLMGEADGQPALLKPWFHLWIGLQHPHAMFFAYLAAMSETALGLALIVGFARKATYVAGAAWSLVIWGTAEGFGGPYNSSSTDIGTAIIYAVVFAVLLAAIYYQRVPEPSVDRALESRISWWHRVAEVGQTDSAPRTRRTVTRAPARRRGLAFPGASPEPSLS